MSGLVAHNMDDVSPGSRRNVWRVRGGLVCFLFMVLTALPAHVLAANHAVTNLTDSDPGSLRSALAIANAGDTITFDPALSGTIDLASDLPDLPSLTFVNAGDITVSRTDDADPASILRTVDGATLSGTLPNMSFTGSSEGDSRGLLTMGSLTLADAFSGSITARGGTGADGIAVADALSMGDFSGTISATTTDDGTARGIFAQNNGISLNDFTGRITVDAAGTGYGMNTNDTLSMRNLSGTIDVTAGRDGRGLVSDEAMSINNITGTVSVKATRNKAYGLRSAKDLAVNSISGTISAESAQDEAYGLLAYGKLDNGAGGAVDISGTVTAQGGSGTAGIYAYDGMKLNITGTVSGSTYAILAMSGTNYDDTVTLGNGAQISGDINLYGGTNVLTMDGAGTLGGAVSNITAMTKSGAGTWDVSGAISTGTLDVQAGKLTVPIVNSNSPAVEASGTITNNGEIALSMDGVTIPAGSTYVAVSSPNALAGGGTYSFAPNMFYSMTTRTNDVVITKDSYAGIISGNKELEAIAAAFDANPAAAGSDLEAVTAKLEKASTEAEFEECLSQLNVLGLESLSGISADTARLFSAAAQVRMAEVRAYQVMMADKGEPDSDDPESWPMVAANGDLTGLIVRSPEIKPNGVHLRVLGRTGGMDSHGGYDGYDYGTFALSGGYDRVIADDFLLGVSGGYALTDADYTDVGSSESKLESYTLGVYGTWFRNDWFVDATIAGAYNKYDITRNVPFLSRTAKSDPTGFTLSAKTAVGQRFGLGEYGLTPSVSLEYTRFSQEAYTETGAGAVNLSVESIESNFLESGLGGKIDRSWDTDFGRIIPELSVMWMHEWLTQSRSLSVSMTGMPSAVLPQTTAEAANDALRFGAGLRVIHDDGLAMTLRYQSEIEAHASSQSLMCEAQVLF